MRSALTSSGLPDDRPFTTHDLRAAGVSRHLVDRWMGSKVIRRPLHGVYVADHLPDSIDLRVACLRLVMPDGCFAVDSTAAWLMAGEVALPPGADLCVVSPRFFCPGAGDRLRNGLCVSGERGIRPNDLIEIRGVPCTSPLRTAWDMGRLETADMALWGMDLMMKVGGFTLEELLDGVERFKGYRGVVQLRSLAPWADAGSESFSEAALRGRWKVAGLPRPTTQISLTIDGIEVARLDMGLPDLLWATEYDGERWHSGVDAEFDATRRQRIRRDFGYDVDVYRRQHLFGHTQNAEVLLRRGYEQARSALIAKRYFLPH